MKRALTLPMVGLLLLSAPAAADGHDPWWGPDKALHFGVSAALGAGGYGFGALLTDTCWERALIGAGAAIGAGGAKELADLAGLGHASWRDFTWDVVGAATGVGFGLAVDAIVRAATADEPAPAPLAPSRVSGEWPPLGSAFGDPGGRMWRLEWRRLKGS
jgi:putative lipoprotein